MPRGLGYLKMSMLKSMLVNKDFQTCHIWLAAQTPANHEPYYKSLLTNMEFSVDSTPMCKSNGTFFYMWQFYNFAFSNFLQV